MLIWVTTSHGWSGVWPAYGLMSEAQAPRAPAKGPSGVRPAHWRRWGHQDPARKLGLQVENYQDTCFSPRLASISQSLLNTCAVYLGTPPRSKARRRAQVLRSIPPVPFSAGYTQNLSKLSPTSSAGESLQPRRRPLSSSSPQPPPQRHACS